jgi:NADH-quinone oxidoreductase subunit L
MNVAYLPLIPIIPLAGAVLNGLLGSRLKRPWVGFIGCGTVLIPFLMSLRAFFAIAVRPEGQRMLNGTLFSWIHSGALAVDFGFVADPLSTVMLLVVTGVGFLIHVYSIGYMHDDPGYARYFSYLNLFIFSMVMLVFSDNMLGMFLGWEGVGLCSYLLIGFWYEDPEKASAGKKAFIVNRIGDVGFLFAMFLLFAVFQTFGFEELKAQTAAGTVDPSGAIGIAITAIGIGLLIGATGKSAQIPLYVWLPDAMAGPTPVSALIHAATMVTAGVYMACRLNFLFILTPTALQLTAIIGCLTALMAAFYAVTQNDIKKVLAYSTISQLGYMFLAVGVGAFTSAIFHLVTHAFFKACLFLGAGSVIHAMGGEQDIRRMGGLHSKMPITHGSFLVATLAIAGIIPLAGFFSKDEILAAAMFSPYGSTAFWLIGWITAGLTAFYMFRLYFLTFRGTCRADRNTEAHLHESPATMTAVLTILGVLSAIGGLIGLPPAFGHLLHIDGIHLLHSWLQPSLTADPGLSDVGLAAELLLMAASLAIALFSIGLAWFAYLKRPGLLEKTDQQPISGRIYRASLHKLWVDELYDGLIVNPIRIVSDRLLWKRIDTKTIDNGLVDGTARLTQALSGLLRHIQTGNAQFYALGMCIGFAAVLSYLLWAIP